MISLKQLLSTETAESILASILQVATDLGLPTTSWQSGGVVRTILTLFARVFAPYETIRLLIVSGGYLDYSTGAWLKLLAKEGYGVDYIQAESGTTTVTLTNAGGANYDWAAGELHLANSVTGKTYVNTGAVSLHGVGSIDISVMADEVGTDSNAAADEITVMVTTALGVTCTNATALIGTDEETDVSLRQRCRDKLGALSPNGPAAAYEYFAKSTAVAVNRVKVEADSTTGQVLVTLASPSGVVQPDDVTTVDTAIKALAVPLCITVTTQSATGTTIAPTYTAYIDPSENLLDSELLAAIQSALEDYFGSTKIPIGGNRLSSAPGTQGYVFSSRLRAVIETAAPFYHVVLSNGDTAIGAHEVAELGAITGTIVQVAQ